MLFNIDWLKDYVDIDISPVELAEKLTMLGHEVDEVKKVGDFDVLDIDLTPNRSDCMNHIGLAREIAVCLGKEFKLPPTDFEEIEEKSGDFLTIEIEDSELTHRFAGKVLKDVEVGPSPEWMAKRLESVGLRSVNNMVDVTNYIVQEIGHPMHAYDLSLLNGSKLVAREAKKGEKVTTLDGEERKLEAGDIVITDAEKIVGLGGVMGGENTEIQDDTKHVALEAAWFNPANVRRTSKRLALSTDASYRFEREADIEGPAFAIERCCHLLKKITNCKIMSGLIDEYPNEHKPENVSFRPEKARQLIGNEISNDEIKSILEALEIEVASEDNYRWKLIAPSFRTDLNIEVDFVEEVARVYGYDNINPTLPAFREGAKSRSARQIVEEKARDTLVSCGLFQAINYSFASVSDNEIASIPENKSVRVLNPIAEDMDYLRGSLLPGLIRTASMNYNYGNQDFAVFETGTVFRKGKGAPDESYNLAMILQGKDYPLHWARKPGKFTFYSLKGIIESLPVINLESNVSWRECKESFFDERESATLYINDIKVGSFGKVSDVVKKHYDLDYDLFAAELSLDVLSGQDYESFNYESVSKFQPVTRDLAVIVDDTLKNSDLLSAIQSLKIEVLRKVTVFDVFRGEKIPEGKKSVAVNFLYQSLQGNFTGEEISGYQDEIISKLKKEFSAEIVQR